MFTFPAFISEEQLPRYLMAPRDKIYTTSPPPDSIQALRRGEDRRSPFPSKKQDKS